MKKIISALALVAIIHGCKKETQTVAKLDNTATIATKLVGHWGGAHEIVHYTDNQGQPQVFDDNIYNEMIFNNIGAFAKYHGSGHEFTGSYIVKSEDGINSFICTSNDPSPIVIAYKINTLTSTTLSVTSSTMPTWSAVKDGITYSGTNAYYEETYTKQ